MSKFSLVYELQYASYQDIVDFKINKNGEYNFKSIKVKERYSGIPKCRKGKYNLSEIDTITNSYSNIDELKNAIGIFQPLHKMFVAYPSKSYINELSVSTGNEELVDKISLFKDDKLINLKDADHLFELIKDNKNFYKFFKSGNYYTTFTFKQIVSYLHHYIKMQEYEPNIPTSVLINDTTERLRNELRKYYVYREIFRAYQDFNNDNSSELVIPQQIITQKKQSDTDVEIEQLMFPGFQKSLHKYENE